MILRLPGRFSAMFLMAGIIALGLLITNESVVCWRAVDPQCLTAGNRGIHEWVRGLIWSADGRTLFLESRGERFLGFRLTVHDMTRADCRGSVWEGPIGITAMEASVCRDARKILLTTQRGNLSWIDLSSFEATDFAPPRSSIFESPTISHDTRLLAATTNQGRVYLCRATQRTLIACQSSESEQVTKLRFSHDDRQLLACRTNGKIEIWDTSTGALRHCLCGSPTAVAAAFLPGGTKVISSLGGSCVQITDLETGEVCWQEPHGLRGLNIIWRLELSQDGSLAAWSGIDNQVVICDLKQPQKRVVFENPTYVMNISFSPDGSHLAVSGTEPVVRIYDTSTGLEEKRIDVREARRN